MFSHVPLWKNSAAHSPKRLPPYAARLADFLAFRSLREIGRRQSERVPGIRGGEIDSAIAHQLIRSIFTTTVPARKSCTARRREFSSMTIAPTQVHPCMVQFTAVSQPGPDAIKASLRAMKP